MVRAFITIGVTSEQLQRLESTLKPKQVRQALFQAVKRTIGGPRSGVLGGLRARVLSEINLTKKYADRVITAKGPHGDIPSGTITVSRESVPLIAFKPRFRKRSGVRVTIGKNKPPLVLSHAFRATVKSAKQKAAGSGGHEGVFLRAKGRTAGFFGGRGARAVLGVFGIKPAGLTPDGYAQRIPIEEQMGPSVLSVYGEAGTTKVAQEELAKAHDLLEKNVQSQIDRFTK